MNWLKTTISIATTLVLLGIDALISLSGTLYMSSIASFGLVAFIVAVPL